MDYSDVLAWLEGRGQFRVTPSLEGITKILEELGRPQDRLKVILVGGTNGKGVAAHHLSRMLQAHGLKVGRNISPHINCLRERVAVDDELISQSSLAKVFSEVMEAASRRGVDLTFFESMTASAYLHFAQEEADWAMMEAGLGGTWDATNVVLPQGVVITTVAHDHTRILGSTLPEIAKAKADLIHPGCQVVTGASKEALPIIEQKAQKEGAKLSVLGRHFKVQKTKLRNDQGIPSGMEFELSTLKQDSRPYFVRLPGEHQAQLAGQCLTLVQKLLVDGFQAQMAQKGLELPPPPARWEVVRSQTPLILDGAHNHQALAALGQLVKKIEAPVVAVVNQMRDKGESTLLPLTDKVGHFVATTTTTNKRALSAADQADRLRGMGVSFTTEGDLAKALEHAQALARKREGIVLVTGSFYMVAEARRVLGLPGSELK